MYHISFQKMWDNKITMMAIMHSFISFYSSIVIHNYLHTWKLEFFKLHGLAIYFLMKCNKLPSFL